MSPLEVRPFDPAEAETISSWVTDEAAAVAWGGPVVRYPVDPAQWAEMLADPARTLWTPTLASDRPDWNQSGRESAGQRDLDRALAGHFQLARDPRRRAVRLGRVAIAPHLRGRRLATPLARLACDIAFRRDPDLHRVELQVYEHNTPARAAYASAGFSLEGTFREDVPVTSAGRTDLWSTVVMAILRREWEGLG